jgi:hypothetical protein
MGVQICHTMGRERLLGMFISIVLKNLLNTIGHNFHLQLTIIVDFSFLYSTTVDGMGIIVTINKSSVRMQSTGLLGF